LIVADRWEGGGGAGRRREVVLVAICDLAAGLRDWNGRDDVRSLLLVVDRIDVGLGEGLAGAKALRDAARAAALDG